MIIMKENMVVIIDLKNFYFDFDLTKDVDENLKYEIEFIVKSNKYLDENKIKSKIEQVLSKYKHGSECNNEYKQGKY